MKLTRTKLKEMIKEELKNIKEADYEKTPVPAEVKRYMNKLITSLKGRNLSTIKKVSVLYKIITALGLETSEVTRYIQRIKREM